MWRRFSSTLVEIQPHHQIFPEMVSNKNALHGFSFRKRELESFNWLFSMAPCYPVKASSISIISEPREFYDTLMKKCEHAEERITFASLYLGTGKMEKNLVSVINDNLKRSHGNLKLNVLLDFHRGSRGRVNSKSMLLPFLENYKRSVHISLYHTPYLRGIYKKIIPQRWNEIIELQHMKVYLIDNTVIISGANLSNDYFTNRQDRYVVIENKELADFYSDLVSVVQGFSLQLQDSGNVSLVSGSPSPDKDNRNVFIGYARSKIEQFYQECLETQWDKGQKHIDSSDTWVAPLMQAGGLNIRCDSEVTRRILSNAPAAARVRLATGYFNLTEEYAKALVEECEADCSLLMAHPNANGFKGARGPAGGVPDAYSLLARKFSQFVEASGQVNRIKLLEYERTGWTYHGKGLWYYPPGEKLPSLTLVGSPNFGERSVNRDLETQVAIITSNTDLRKRLHKECETLHQEAKKPDDLFERKIPAWVHMTVGIFRNYF